MSTSTVGKPAVPGRPTADEQPAPGLSREAKRVFIGLMLGMLVASISQTIVGPAMPRIVAELGGMDHYSWVATAAMLVSAVSVPIVGKLSDLYGRRRFYIGGLMVFMLGSVLCGMAGNFWFLIAARAVQGLGMGTIMPLSQTIIGDIIPPRQRGKYQGLMGAVFGVTSVAGPLAGGFITDNWGWRWLFYVTLPVGLFALVVIARFLHLPHQRRDARIDYWGMSTLAVALVSLLLATSFGGTTYPWNSTEIITLYAVGAVFLVVFLIIETRAEEPVIPLRLFRSSVFTFSNIASFAVSMTMFGSIIYIPVYAQGVLGVSATNSGAILIPMSLSMILTSIGIGLLITKTGRYKELTLGGTVVLALGVWLLTRLTHDSSQLQLSAAMVVLGLGLGACMQVYTLVVQNSARRADLGVATASTQFFRNVGSTIGVAVFGTIMTSRLQSTIPAHLPAQLRDQGAGAAPDLGSVLDPAALAQLPPVVADAVRQGLADALHSVFLAALPLAAVVFVATLLIKYIPLRDTVHTAEEAGQEMLEGMGHSAHSSHDVVVPLGRGGGATRTGERLLGLQLELLAQQAFRADRPLLRQAVTDLGEGDFDRGVALLSRTAVMLTTEKPDVAAHSERYALEVASRSDRRGGVLSEELRRRLAARAADVDEEVVLAGAEPTVQERFEGLDMRKLRATTNDLTGALLVDLDD